MTADIRIGHLATMTRTTQPTIRYYETIGLLPSASRQDGGQRVYGEADVRRLTFIRRCREFGFPIDRVRQLVSLVQDRERSCMEAREIASAHLTQVRQKLKEFQELELSIAAFVESCDTTCAGGVGADCAMLVKLAEAVSDQTVDGKTCCGPTAQVRSAL